MLKAKLHMDRVTVARLDYSGSMTIDEDLIDAVGLLEHEKILVANVENGNRFETYAIPGPRGSGTICLNGAAAHKGRAGDRVIVLNFALMTVREAKRFKPRVLCLDAHNKPAPCG